MSTGRLRDSVVVLSLLAVDSLAEGEGSSWISRIGGTIHSLTRTALTDIAMACAISFDFGGHRARPGHEDTQVEADAGVVRPATGHAQNWDNQRAKAVPPTQLLLPVADVCPVGLGAELLHLLGICALGKGELGRAKSANSSPDARWSAPEGPGDFDCRSRGQIISW